jgi:hypothetical protein
MAAPLRLSIFIDEQNILREVRPKPAMLDVVGLAELVTEGCNRSGRGGYQLGRDHPIVVCVGAPPHSGAPEYARHLLKRRLWAQMGAVRMVEGDLVWVKEEHRWKQDAVDVAMAVEAVLTATRGECDAIVLVTADRDLSYAAKACAERLSSIDSHDRRPRVFTASVPPHRVPGFAHIDVAAEAVRALDTSALLDPDEEAALDLYSFEVTDAQHLAERTAGFVRWLVTGVDDVGKRLLLLVHEYLRAVWWWEPQAPSVFADRLLDAWGRTATWEQVRRAGTADAHRTVAAQLRAFTRAHRSLSGSLAPAARRRAADAALASLIAIDGELPLTSRRPAMPARQPRGRGSPDGAGEGRVARAIPVTGGLLDLFAAEIWAARSQPLADGDRAEADARYAAAAQWFSGAHEQWYLAWAHYGRGALNVAAPSGAMTTADVELDDAERVSLALTGDDLFLRDYELMASIARARSDLVERRGERAASWEHCARAVFYALAFQVRPHEPDRYTKAFFDETVAWATSRLAGDPAAVQAALQWWRGAWHPEGAELFPPGPTEGDFGVRRSPFTSWVLALVGDVEQRGCPWPAPAQR